MLIEQPSELNRFVDPGIPLTWAGRMRLLREFMPLLVFISFLGAETAGIRAWTAGQPVLWFIVGYALGPPVVLFLAMEVSFRLHHGRKRTLELGPKKVMISPPWKNCNRVKWDLVRAWHFEPIPGQPGQCKLGFHFLPGRRARCMVSWFMVVPSQAVRSALLGELHARWSQSPGQFRILEAKEPLEPPPRRRSAGVWSYLVGALLLLHGLGLLGLSWVADWAQGAPSRAYQAQPAHPRQENLPRLAPAKSLQRARLMRIIRLTWLCGWGLAVSGAALVTRGVVLLTRSRRAADAELASYFVRVGLAGPAP